MKLADLNFMGDAAFVATLGDIFEHSPWVAQQTITAGPFASIDALHGAMMAAVRHAPTDHQLALLRAHVELAGKAAIGGELTLESHRNKTARTAILPR